MRAGRFDLRPGTALDLRTRYDFNKDADRLRVRVCQKDEKPLKKLEKWTKSERS